LSQLSNKAEKKIT